MMQTKKQRGVDKNKLSRNVFIFAMIIVPALHFLVFYLYVNFNSILMAFKYPIKGEETWSLRNFTWFFSEFSAGALDPAKANSDNIPLQGKGRRSRGYELVRSGKYTFVYPCACALYGV